MSGRLRQAPWWRRRRSAIKDTTRAEAHAHLVTERIVVIGADAAGMSAASQAKRMTGDAVEIVAFERGTYSFYAACGIPYWVAGDVDEPSTRLSLILARTRLCTVIARHAVLVMAALAICAVTAALLKDRTGTQAPKPVRPDQPPPAEPGMIPLTVRKSGSCSPQPSSARARPRQALAGLATPPPGPLTLVPPAHAAYQEHRNCPGQIAIGGCLTSRRLCLYRRQMLAGTGGRRSAEHDAHRTVTR